MSEILGGRGGRRGGQTKYVHRKVLFYWVTSSMLPHKILRNSYILIHSFWLENLGENGLGGGGGGVAPLPTQLPLNFSWVLLKLIQKWHLIIL